ncbi:hypothetical protein [Candidatus Binatus sp.]|jgi:hypothetical protein
MNPTVLNYVALMLYNLRQNPRGTILTLLSIALAQLSVLKAISPVRR